MAINLAPTRITISIIGDNFSWANDLGTTFNGFRFFDAGSSAPSLVGAVLSGSVDNVSAAPLAVDANNIYINLTGLGGELGRDIVIDLQFEAVPESSTWAAGLVALPVAGMWLRRRSARR